MLEINNLSIKHKNSSIILSDISFNVPPKSIVTVIGKNASGKSILLKGITRLLPKDFTIEGEVRVGENNLFSLTEKELSAIRGNLFKYVFQDPIGSFDPLKKLEYYLSMQNPNKAEFDEILGKLSLPGSDSIGEMHSYELSVGMAQRILLALALALPSQMLLLDEPTSALDVDVKNRLLFLLKDYTKIKQRSLLLTTQDIEFAKRISDLIIHMKEGRIVKILTPDTFISLSEEAI